MFEPSIAHLQALIIPNSTIIDVGANVGFYTLKFSQWVLGDGKVIAIEPEPKNCSALRRAILKKHLLNVEVLQVAAAESEGELFLSLNPLNPADHKLAAKGISIKAVTIDGLLEKRGWPHVSLIKIDVQGAEPRTLLGAQKTISRFHPAIFIEIDEPSLNEAGSSSDALIDSIRALGYQMYGSKKDDLEIPLTNKQAKLRCDNVGYADFIFLHENSKCK